MNYNYQSVFKKDQNYTPLDSNINYQGPHIVQTYLRKEKSSSSYKFFSDQNTRFFTLNMKTFEFYYTPKESYQQKDIKYIDMNKLKYAINNGFQKNQKGQNKEWTSMITLYFEGNYTNLYCQNESMKQIWLNAFQHIIRISDNKSLLCNIYFYNKPKLFQSFQGYESLTQTKNYMIYFNEYINNILIQLDSENNSESKNNENNKLKEPKSNITNGDDHHFQKISISKDSNSNSPNNSQNSIGGSKDQKQKQFSQQKIGDISKNSLDSDGCVQKQNSQANSQINSNINIKSNEDLEHKERNLIFSAQKQVQPAQNNKKTVVDEKKIKQKRTQLYIKYKLLPVLRKKIEIARTSLIQQHKMKNQQKETIKVLQPTEEQSQQVKKYSDNNQVDVENIDTDSLQILPNNNTLHAGVILNEHHHKSAKKSLRSSPMKNASSGKKNKINIFDADLQDEKDQVADLQIELQSRQSQNGWDKNDINILQDILRQNSAQLKIGREDENSVQSPHSENQSQEYQQQKPQQQQNSQPKQISPQIQQNDDDSFNQKPSKNSQQKNKDISLDKGNNPYDDWDNELDSIPTPIMGNNKGKKQNQDQNNNQFISSKYENSEVQKLNQSNQGQNMQVQQQSGLNQNKQQSQKPENDYDNWDDEM